MLVDPEALPEPSAQHIPADSSLPLTVTGSDSERAVLSNMVPDSVRER